MERPFLYQISPNVVALPNRTPPLALVDDPPPPYRVKSTSLPPLAHPVAGAPVVRMGRPRDE